MGWAEKCFNEYRQLEILKKGDHIEICDMAVSKPTTITTKNYSQAALI